MNVPAVNGIQCSSDASLCSLHPDCSRQKKEGLKILWVDDSKLVRKCYEAYMKDLPGFQAYYAKNLEMALEMIENMEFDYIVTDYDLGNGNIADKVIELARNKSDETPIMLVTSHPKESDVVTHLSPYHIDHKEKPFTRENLHEFIHEPAPKTARSKKKKRKELKFNAEQQRLLSETLKSINVESLNLP